MNDFNKLNNLFNKAKTQSTVASFDEVKAKFLSSSGASTATNSVKKTQVLTTKKWIIMLATIGIIVLSILLIPSNSQEKIAAIDSQQGEETVANIKNENLKDGSVSIVQEKLNQPEYIDSKLMAEPILNEEAPIVNKGGQVLATIDYSKPRTKHPKSSIVGEVYRFPKLSEDEIVANHRQKKKMLKAITKMDKKSYAYIPSGSFTFEGDAISVHAFYMQRNEVTVLEYRTFLFDLLIQNRKDEFLKARPNQAEWTEILGDIVRPMQDQYFSHEAYNNYPINNITREGAQMYCKWLTLEAIKYDSKNSNMNDMRIPHKDEWVYAASNGGKNMTYPWIGELIHNQNGCFLANFDIQKFSGDIDSLQCLKAEKKSKQEQVITSDGAMYTAKTGTYNPNDFGLYNMSGNVAEMIYIKNRKTHGTAGGGWMSSDQELYIGAADPYMGVVDENLNIGFRVVTTFIHERVK